MVDRRCGRFLILLGMLSVGIWPMVCGAQEAVPTQANVAYAPTSVSIHHPMFGKLMCDQYAALGLTCVLVSKDMPSEISPWMFLTRILGMERR